VSKPVEIFTDGACRGNPGPGGWAALLRFHGHEKKMWGAKPHTTNNRMELMAAIMAFSSLTRPCNVIITTDSEYVRKGITEWLPIWKQRGWKTKTNAPVKNQDLWQQLDEVTVKHNVTWQWVKGHSGHYENDLVDELAKQAINNLQEGNPDATDNT
jgi:ribonuclease HI